MFALSATARAGYQILTKFSEAPLAYLLSAFAAVVYIVATVSLAKAGRTWFKVSVTAVLVELVGVLVVGALSLFDAVNFPHETVWSLFGRGYGFIPLLLPILGPDLALPSAPGAQAGLTQRPLFRPSLESLPQPPTGAALACPGAARIVSRLAKSHSKHAYCSAWVRT